MDMEEHSDRPQVAQVIDIDNDICTIQWFKGAKSVSWKPCTIPVQGKRGKREPWIVQVPISKVIFCDFKLTKSGHLPKTVKDFCTAYHKHKQ